MKKIKFLLMFLIFLALIYFLVSRIPITPADKNDINVLLLYNQRLTGEYQYVIEAYQSVLQEEGIPFKTGQPSMLLASDPGDIVRYYPAIIFPDGAAQILPPDMHYWVKEYLKHGGHIACIFDAGTKSLKGTYMDKGVFSQLVGMNYIVYNQLEDANDAYLTAFIRFKDSESARFFQFPPGKISDQYFVSGYSYGQLIFPTAMVKTLSMNQLNKKEIFAYGVTEAGENFPLIILKKILSGNLLYVNLPLGHLKAYSDDLWLRAILRTFLFKVVKVPHLVNTPDGKGGLVLNLHIDWYEDWKGITFMKENGYFTPNIRYSFHNTAGDFTNRPGDGLGFDACGRGRKYLRSILKYGKLGSHGGWAHNWFYQNIEDGSFGEEQIEQYIVKNNKCLERVSGYPVIEYSAPNGVHPQPLLTNILGKHGIIAYYYTGDSGSAPNRTFFNKKMVSDKIIAFPVLSYQDTASLFEMKLEGISSKALKQWLTDLLAFVGTNRTIRLIYSHSYDIPPYYPGTFKQFIDLAEKKCREGEIYIQPMSYFAGFLHRFLKTRYRFRWKGSGVEIFLKNPEGLANIVTAIPAQEYEKPVLTGIEVEEDDDYYYLRLKEHIREKKIYIDYRSR